MAETKKARKKPGPKKGTGGRPVKNLDQKLFEKYCKYGSTLEEVADYFEVDVNTVNAWCKRTYGTTFSEVYKKHASWINMSLRGAQIRSALGQEARTEIMPDGTRIEYKGFQPSIPMQIWLGKQRLGQVDQPVDESRKETYQEPESLKSDD
jgi:hypothetical protein